MRRSQAFSLRVGYVLVRNVWSQWGQRRPPGENFSARRHRHHQTLYGTCLSVHTRWLCSSGVSA